MTHSSTAAEAEEDTGGRKRSHCSQVQRRLTLLVLHGGIGSVGQQQGAQLGPPLLRRFMERRERPLISGVDARVVLDQQGGDVHVLVGTMEKKREFRKILKESLHELQKHGSEREHATF